MKFGFQHIGFKLLLLSILPLFNSCKKEVGDSVNYSQTFLKSYSTPGGQNLYHLKKTDDGGCLLIGSSDGDSLIIYRTDNKGHILWKSKPAARHYRRIWGTELTSGDVLITGADYGNITKIDRNGNLVFSTKFDSSIAVYSDPVAIKDGRYLVSYTNGQSLGGASTNKMALVKSDGSVEGYAVIPDNVFLVPGESSFKVTYLGLYRCDTLGDYYFNGWCLPNWNGNWYSNFTIFVARLIYDRNNKVVYKKKTYIDPPKVAYRNQSYFQTITSDKGVILAATRADVRTFISEGNLVKIDNDLNISWQTVINVSPLGTTLNKAIECPDGGYIVTGSCITPNKSLSQPFACKVSKSGKILWTKTYPTLLNSILNFGYQIPDGTLMLGGTSLGFGKGTNDSDIFLMKTDENGNID